MPINFETPASYADAKLTETHLTDMAREYVKNITGMHDGISSLVESPIEATMFISIWHSFSQQNIRLAFKPWKRGISFQDVPDEHDAVIISQAEIGDYRADFVIVMGAAQRPANVGTRIVVECDGHEFHDRTKEQAKRDRERDRFMQDQGFRVYRFTGSEIYNSPLKCSEAVLRSLWFVG